MATVWALLPAFTDLKLGFPRSWVTVGLAALGFVLTLVAWIDTFKWNFSIWALLGMITATAILLFSVLPCCPNCATAPLPGGLANAAQWANQPASSGSVSSRASRSGPAGPTASPRRRTGNRRSSSSRRRPRPRRVGPPPSYGSAADTRPAAARSAAGARAARPPRGRPTPRTSRGHLTV